MNCVCSHPEADHKPATMSVPLTTEKEPLYKLPVTMYGHSVINRHPNATYDTVQCHCGCQEYLPDG